MSCGGLEALLEAAKFVELQDSLKNGALYVVDALEGVPSVPEKRNSFILEPIRVATSLINSTVSTSVSPLSTTASSISVSLSSVTSSPHKLLSLPVIASSTLQQHRQPLSSSSSVIVVSSSSAVVVNGSKHFTIPTFSTAHTTTPILSLVSSHDFNSQIPSSSSNATVLTATTEGGYTFSFPSSYGVNDNNNNTKTLLSPALIRITPRLSSPLLVNNIDNSNDDDDDVNNNNNNSNNDNNNNIIGQNTNAAFFANTTINYDNIMYKKRHLIDVNGCVVVDGDPKNSIFDNRLNYSPIRGDTTCIPVTSPVDAISVLSSTTATTTTITTTTITSITTVNTIINTTATTTTTTTTNNNNNINPIMSKSAILLQQNQLPSSYYDQDTRHSSFSRNTNNINSNVPYTCASRSSPSITSISSPSQNKKSFVEHAITTAKNGIIVNNYRPVHFTSSSTGHQQHNHNPASVSTAVTKLNCEPLALSIGEMRKRLGASGTREVHNKLEKNRRAHLKECFELLKSRVPMMRDEKKTSNLTILRSAIRYIGILKRREKDFEQEKEIQYQKKISCQQKLTHLKKELSAQWDHIDFNALLPEIIEYHPQNVSKEAALKLESSEAAALNTSNSNGSNNDRDMISDDTDDTSSHLRSRSTLYSSSTSTSSVSSISPLNVTSPTRINSSSPSSISSIHQTQVTDQSEIIPVQYFAPNATIRIVPMDSEPIALIQHNSADQKNGLLPANGSYRTVYPDACNNDSNINRPFVTTSCVIPSVVIPNGLQHLSTKVGQSQTLKSPNHQFYLKPTIVVVSSSSVISK